MVTAACAMRPPASAPVNQESVDDGVTDATRMPTIRVEAVSVSVETTGCSLSIRIPF